MKIKLAIVDVSHDSYDCEDFDYIFNGDNMEYWKYSPDYSEKIIESVF